ncbi:ABC transporter substrate-binding protein [Acetobacter sp.]|jgi:NitT/TauT family transport system ATP-binding protein|uniref:ABC transporter substrate-binding protein n=1 Tax=Acetobacter sp. TaxID=440 RepID=UPI0025B96F39|nr:ABC transporter substrate-binding protein [Acetobacter sp.]MCH4091404.1 ABC transporter substrate-binding protein [Acetobacter sp.]MCI1299382.1 ABC transporter substrate-binding protein [Acetobacter sp.]MCI1316614.1 ABC transporter substrate-binding protein [Acetobacter sp.]
MKTPIRIGVLQLADSAPVIMAQQQGLFARHGLETDIVVSPSWANIADGLVWKKLDAAVVFCPLAMMTALGRRGHGTLLRPLGTISRGGNTIMLRGANPVETIWHAGSQGRRAFDIWRSGIGRRPRIAVVHSYSTHLLILRRFLKMIDVDMESDIELLVMPPVDMIHALSEKKIDGGCVGPPWGTEAERIGVAFRVGGSSSVFPDHVEKIMVASGELACSEPKMQAMTRALQEAISFCQQPHHRQGITDALAASLPTGGLALPAEATHAVLPEGSAAEAISFSSGMLQKHDIEWIIHDMMALGWLENTERQTLMQWSASGALTSAPPVPL